jgi:hypothetical protein
MVRGSILMQDAFCGKTIQKLRGGSESFLGIRAIGGGKHFLLG